MNKYFFPIHEASRAFASVDVSLHNEMLCLITTIFYDLHHFLNSCTVSGRGRFTGHFLFLFLFLSPSPSISISVSIFASPAWNVGQQPCSLQHEECSSHALSSMKSAAAMLSPAWRVQQPCLPTAMKCVALLSHKYKGDIMHSFLWREQRSLQHFLPSCAERLSCNSPVGNMQQLCIFPAW